MSNVGYSLYVLFASTILNSRAMYYLVNTLNLIVLGIFVANTNSDIVKVES